MIPAADTLVVEDTMPALGGEVEAKIGSPKWVMRALADLYSDAILAFIREYSTNAYDAQVDAVRGTGKAPSPIKVTLPTALSPYFTVADSGIGMSTNTLREMYVSFGDSDKRDKNDANGMLGFGCKAAVAYTTSFTVESVKDNIQTTAVVSRKEDWTITLRVVSTVKVDKPNGTIVTIPVDSNDINEVRHKANNFYRYWLPGRVLVDGAEVTHYVGDKVTDNFYYAARGQNYWTTTPDSIVVMGNVPYPIRNPEHLFRNSKMKPFAFVAYVDNGDVEFSNSREDLKYTENTKNTLDTLFADFEKQLIAEANKEVQTASDHAEAYKIYSKWTERVGEGCFDELTYKGDKFEPTINFTDTTYRYKFMDAALRVKDWSIDRADNTLFIVGYDYTLSSSHKKNAVDWSRENKKNTQWYIFTRDKSIDSVWLDSDRVVDYATIKEFAKKERTSSGPNAGRIPGSFDYATKDGWKHEQEIPVGAEVVWATRDDTNRRDLPGILKAVGSDAIIIDLTMNRQAKFKRENPKVPYLSDWVSKHVKNNALDFLSADAVELLSYNENTIRWSRALAGKTDDPFFDRVATLEAKREKLLEDYKKANSKVRKLGFNMKNYPAETSKYLKKTYPLVVASNRHSWYDEYKVIPHTIEYINYYYKKAQEAAND